MTKPVKLLKDQVVVITGASSGIGKGAALKFAEAGTSLVLAARRGVLLDELMSICKAKGAKVIAVATDVSKPQEVEKLALAALAAFGRIDAWVNDAGVGAIGKFDSVPLADHEQVIKTNLLGTLYGSYAALAQFRRQGSGILINVASMLGKVPSPYYASYNASKSGIIGLSTTLQLELKEQKIRDIHVCTVLPMAMDTPFFEHAGNYTGREAVPIPPIYDAQKVVDAIVGLAQKPQDETIVGGAGTLADIAHRVAPHLVETMTAMEVQQVQMEHQKPVANTSGSIHQSVSSGTGVHAQKKNQS